MNAPFDSFNPIEAALGASRFEEKDCVLAEFEALTSRSTDSSDAPNSVEIVENVPVYDGNDLAERLSDSSERRKLMSEWARILFSGPGAIAIRSMHPDLPAIDEATEVFERIIAEERESGSGGDHFAGAGANDRIWNSLQKLCLSSPDLFARYHGVPAIDAICESWLGPNYQMSAQVNLVRPGGKAQSPHRDYHLGFQSAESASLYPAHVHLLSPILTLQGGIAHCDMPVEAGPTQLLPFSQTYAAGYVAWRRKEFKEHFRKNCVQLPMRKGDGLFFNPAMFHAGGENRTESIRRLMNLLQISSAFGRAMESIDRTAMSKALHPALLRLREDSFLSPERESAAIRSAAEGYSFPANLDRDAPGDDMTPETQRELLVRAVEGKWSAERFDEQLRAMRERRKP